MIMLLHSHQLQPVVQLQFLIMKTQQLQLKSPVATSCVQLGCSFLQLLQLDLKRLSTMNRPCMQIDVT